MLNRWLLCERLETLGMRQITSTRVVLPQPPVPCGGRPLFSKNSGVADSHQNGVSADRVDELLSDGRAH